MEKYAVSPEKVIHWTTMGLMDIAEKLKADYGIEVCHTVVSKELTKMGYLASS